MDEKWAAVIHPLYKRNYERMVATAYRLVGNMEQAEDLTQEAFVRAVMKVDELKTHPNPDGWLMRTLINCIRNAERRSTNRELPLDDVIEQAAVAPDLGLEEVLPRNLAEEDRRLLIWRYQDGLSGREIAERLGITENAGRTRLFRAAARCRALMDESKRKEGKRRG